MLGSISITIQHSATKIQSIVIWMIRWRRSRGLITTKTGERDACELLGWYEMKVDLR
jgi:hypothetical protein